MSCENHLKSVAGISDMKVLAEQISELHYETLVTLFDELRVKFYADAAKDSEGGREKLSVAIVRMSFNMEWARNNASKAWEVSKPFMNNNK